VGEKSYLKAVGNRPYRENEERRLVTLPLEMKKGGW
jgi:hypothetical protein